jgi:hypothetical protein
MNWLSDRGVIFYTASDDATLDAQSPVFLWAARVDAAEQPEPVRVREFDGFFLEQVWGLSRSTFALVVRDFHDPEHETLQFWRVDLAGGEVETLQRDLESLRLGSDEIATVDRDGRLTVFNQRNLERPTFTADDRPVLAGSTRFVFGSEDPALAFLADPHDLDPAEDEEDWVGQLELRFGSTGERLEIAEDVREFQEVWWPERGLLYTVASGREMGIHFAAVDIPCEQATGSQWACGF